MSQSESPRDFYHRLENGLSPLIRLMLAEHLPKIGGRKWWEACVLSSLTPIQLEYVREPENLEQFDFPALVNIVHHNWRTLRPSLGIGNEFTNYLFSLKTLRNEVEHRPDLVLDDERRRHLEQSARLAMRLLDKDETTGPNLCTPLVARSMRAGILASAIAVVGLGVLLLKPGDAVTVTPSEAADPAPAAARTAQAETKHITAGLASKLGSDRINVCMRYQRNDGTWSKRYTVYATLEYGWRLNELLHQSLYKPDIRHLVVHWRKTDDYTVIPLNAGEARPPETFAAYRDSRTRPWELKTGWDGCRTPDADAQKRSWHLSAKLLMHESAAPAGDGAFSSSVRPHGRVAHEALDAGAAVPAVKAEPSAESRIPRLGYAAVKTPFASLHAHRQASRNVRVPFPELVVANVSGS